MPYPRFLTFVTLCALASVTQAQEGTGSGAAGGSTGSTSSSGASSAFGSPSNTAPSRPSPAASYGASTAPAANPAAFAPPPGTSSSATGFGTGIGTGTAVQSGQTPGTEIPGGSLGGGAARTEESPTSFSISTGYGRAPEVFVSGEGRLARPRFQTRVSGSIGFDDNIFQTPTNAKATPDTVIRQQISEATPDQVVLVPVPDDRPRRIGVITPPRQQQFRSVFIPGQEAQFQEIVIPGSPKPKRQVSAISRESFSFQAQVATRRTVFTFDLNANADYYWNRPKDKAEYNGSLAVRYLHRFSPRLQFTASVDASYLSQPDLTQINTPTGLGAGNYLVVTAKSDLSYRWTPRFTSVVSLSYNQLTFDEPVRQTGDYRGLILGGELRYLWSPRLTAVMEGRYGQISYLNNPALDSSTLYALIGFDLSLSRRASATVRVGESLREFDAGGGSSSSPYLEATLNYQLAKASVLSWNNRFGFEEPGSATSEIVSFRSGVSVTHFFGPRLRGSLGVNAIFRRTTDDTAQTESNETTLDSTLSVLYTLTRSWTFNLNYSYTTLFVDPGESDYFRNRLFAGFDYSF